jgi:SHAQKYF class myb-like DNA-binding protein
MQAQAQHQQVQQQMQMQQMQQMQMQIQMQMQASMRTQGAGAGAGGPGTLVGEIDFNDGGAGGGDRGGGDRGKAKRRFLWTENLHRRFVAAMFDYGVQNATPKTLFQLMQVRARACALSRAHAMRSRASPAQPDPFDSPMRSRGPRR